VGIVTELTVIGPLLGPGGQFIVPDYLTHIFGTRLTRVASGGHDLPEAIVLLQDD